MIWNPWNRVLNADGYAYLPTPLPHGAFFAYAATRLFGGLPQFVKEVIFYVCFHPCLLERSCSSTEKPADPGSKRLAGGTYHCHHHSVHSFTHGNTYDAIVPTSLLSPDDRILLIDDFLAHGAALCGLLSIVKQSGAHLCGCAIAIEKAFQGGGDKLRAEGIRIDSLACIASMSPEDGIVYR